MNWSRALVALSVPCLFMAGCVSLQSQIPVAPDNDEDVAYETIVERTQGKWASLVPESSRIPSQSASGVWNEAAPGEIFSAVTDAQVMILLEKSGFRLQDLLNDGRAQVFNNAEFFAGNSLYKQFVEQTRVDIAASVTEENRHRPDWGDVGKTLKSKRRQLDPAWLINKDAHYELTGVVNRIDRVVFEPETCGELRFLYRLAYKTKKINSRLPLTINMVYDLKKTPQGCVEYINAWRAPNDLRHESFADWFLKGALQGDFYRLARLRALETNYQVIRSSAGIRNLLGGSAEYILRVFHIRDGKLVRGYLENTPNLAAFKKDPELKKALLDFLRSEKNFDLLDRGILKIPDRFLAVAASSFAPHGIARMENRPYDVIFSESDFAGLDFARREHVKTAGAVIRRLNDLSCVGCHQNRTIAGFHFLGSDRPGTHPLNAVFFAGSGHFRSELVRRGQFLDDMASGRRPSGDRPFSIAPTGARAKYGDFCGLPNGKAFRHWVCEDGLECAVVDPAEGEKELGKCFPKVRLSGDPCLQNILIQNHHSLDKTIQPVKEIGCNKGDPKYTCQPPGQGFPSGMCTTSCSHMKGSGEICGPIAGTGFGNCIASPDRTFDQCLEATREFASRGRCNHERSCRNDYVCARIDGKDGACLPSYFLFQIRVDGHPQL